MVRNDIDTLELSAKCTPNNKMKSLVTKLLQQDQRVWKVNYFVGDGPVAIDQEWLAHLQPVRFLALGRVAVDRDIELEQLVPVLKSLKNLEELDLSSLCLSSSELIMLYQHDILAEKIPHILMKLSGPCPYSAQFSSIANSSMIGNNTFLEGNLATECIQESSILRTLRGLGIQLTVNVPPTSTMAGFHALSTWIGSSSCQLTHLGIYFPLPPPLPDGGGSSPVMEGFQSLVPAIGRNRSITHLSIFYKTNYGDDDNIISRLLPQMATKMNCINQVQLDFVTAYIGSKDSNFLRNWLIQMRSTRFIALYLRNSLSPTREYLHRVHTRWIRWEQLCRRKPPTSAPSIFIRGYRNYWANELERIDCTNQPELRAISLDAMFFLLRRWLSNTSKVRNRSRLKICEEKWLEEGVPRNLSLLGCDDSSRLRFPPLTSKHSSTLVFPDKRGPWPSLVQLRGRVKQSSRLDNLGRLTFQCSDFPVGGDYLQYLTIFSRWIRASNCSIRQFEFLFSPGNDHFSMTLFQELSPALGENRSIRQLGIHAPNHHIRFISQLLPYLCQNGHGKVFYLLIHCNWDEIESEKDLDFLLQWQIQMRFLHHRLVILDLHPPKEKEKLCAKITYVSQMHARWQNWHSFCRLVVQPSLLFRALKLRQFANELERLGRMCHRQDRAELRVVSLDAIYYRLQRRLRRHSSHVPSHPTGNRIGRQT